MKSDRWLLIIIIATIISTIISLIALLLTLYQLYLLRVHNEKSLKPLGQIDFRDRKTQLHIYIRNNGMGPLIIDKLTFTKGDNIYNAISDCLNLDPKSYSHIQIDGTVNKTILPNKHLVVFKKKIENHTPEEIEFIRKQLTPITLKVDCRDIYDNKFSFERKLDWFSRHIFKEVNQSD